MTINPAVIATLKADIEAYRLWLAEDDADETLRSDVLEGQTDIDSVLSRVARARIQARADGVGASEAKKAAAAHYERRMAIAEKQEKLCDHIIRTILEAAGMTKFAVPEGKISITPGRVSLVLADDFEPPQGYQKIKVTPDNAAIKSALEAGEKMPGASLVTGKPSVRIV